MEYNFAGSTVIVSLWDFPTSQLNGRKPQCLLFTAAYILHVVRYSNQYNDYTTDWTAGVRFPSGPGTVRRHRVQTGSGAHPASYQMSTGDIFLGVKRPWIEAEQSPPSSAETKYAWSYTSTPPYIFMEWRLVTTGEMHSIRNPETCVQVLILFCQVI
jgi:hypothetical protein